MFFLGWFLALFGDCDDDVSESSGDFCFCGVLMVVILGLGLLWGVLNIGFCSK